MGIKGRGMITSIQIRYICYQNNCELSQNSARQTCSTAETETRERERLKGWITVLHVE